MPKLRVHCFAMSLDGYGAGPNQDLDNPLGVGGAKTSPPPLRNVDLASPLHLQLASLFDHSSCTV
jgi:hypothetical protein